MAIEINNIDYIALKRRYVLRVVKGVLILEDMYTGDILQLTKDEFSFLILCNGKYTQQEIFLIYEAGLNNSEEASKVKLCDYMVKYKDMIIFSKHPWKYPRFLNLSTILQKRTDIWPFHKAREETPHYISLCITRKCNYVCRYCFLSCDNRIGDELNINQWLDVLEQAAAIGVQQVCFTGGEPMLVKEFPLLIKRAKELDIFSTINTNGSLLDNEIIERLKMFGAERFQLSLPSVSNDLYRTITRSNVNLDVIERAIKTLKEYDLYVQVKMVLIPQNISDVEDLIHFCGINEVDSLHLAPFILTAKSRENFNLIPSDKSLKYVYNLASSMKITYPKMRIIPPQIGIWNWITSDDIVVCDGIKESLSIDANGTISLCEAISDNPIFQLGNVKESTIAEIWNSEIPDKILDVSKPKQPCDKCEHFKFCNTGCFMLSDMIFGDPYAVDPRCFSSTKGEGWPKT